MHWTNITTIVGESTHIVNRIKSLTVPCGSRLMLIFFSSGRCFFCCLLGTGTACSPETVGFQTGCSCFDRLGLPGLRNAKLFGFPPGCSFLDREHDLRKILIRQQIHSKKFLVAKQQLITCLTDRNDSPLRWRSLRDWVYMNSHDCILCRSSSSCCVSSCEDRMRSTSLRACVCSRLSPARLSACRRRSCSLLRSSLSSAVKVGRLVLRDSMGASKLDL